MPDLAYAVVDVSSWPVADTEAAGLDEKTWLTEPGRDEDSRWLFKPASEKSWGMQGEDWAEKIATELAVFLGVPCARVELAARNGKRGTISRNLAPDHWEIQPGMVPLSAVVDGYAQGSSNPPGRPGHSLQNIQEVLKPCGPPPDADLPRHLGAFDVFAGYLLFDAWVANRDRHDENWSVLRPPAVDAQDLLAGSYDHASSLGFNLQDERRARCLREGQIAAWVERGTAWRFEHDPDDKIPTLVYLAKRALDMTGYTTQRYWLNQLRSVTDSDIQRVVHRVPELSEVTRTFVLEVLRTNRRRLLDEY